MGSSNSILDFLTPETSIISMIIRISKITTAVTSQVWMTIGVWVETPVSMEYIGVSLSLSLRMSLSLSLSDVVSIDSICRGDQSLACDSLHHWDSMVTEA